MKLIAACIVSFLITLVTGRFLLPELRRLKAGQSIREDGPTWHAGKSGTPTMGGLMFIFGILVTILVFGWDAMREGSFAHLYVFAFAAVFGLIGFLDDFQKVKMHRNLGLTAIQKFALQLAAAVVFLCLMRYEGMLTPNLYVPFANTYVILPWIVYMIFAAFVIVGTVNAVNITDGIDGLAGSVTVPVALFFAVVGSWWGYENDLGVFAAAMVGGLIGFLVYNFHPAKVFMGDTGSLTIGGIIGVFAVLIHKELLTPLLCGIFLVESLSVIMQVSYFKYTKRRYGEGRRLFKMAPLHHHFQKAGESIDALWKKPFAPIPESKIVIRFWIIGIILAALTLVTLKMR